MHPTLARPRKGPYEIPMILSSPRSVPAATYDCVISPTLYPINQWHRGPRGWRAAVSKVKFADGRPVKLFLWPKQA